MRPFRTDMACWKYEMHIFIHFFCLLTRHARDKCLTPSPLLRLWPIIILTDVEDYMSMKQHNRLYDFCPEILIVTSVYALET